MYGNPINLNIHTIPPDTDIIGRGVDNPFSLCVYSISPARYFSCPFIHPPCAMGCDMPSAAVRGVPAGKVCQYVRYMYALIIAGGKGERLRPLTDTLPKPMLPVGGRPLAEHQVTMLRDAGVTDVVFLTGHLAGSIREYFRDGNGFGIRIHYSHEETPLGRGGAIRKGLSLVPRSDDPVIVLNGDIVTAMDMRELLADYRKRLSANPEHRVTVLTVPMRSPYGITDTDPDGLISGFREKILLPYSINGGVYVMNRSVEDALPEVGDQETETFPNLAAAGGMSAVHCADFWCSVDSYKDMRAADAFLGH